MNHWDVLYEIQVRRHQEDIAWAERYRLAKEALQINPERRIRSAFSHQRLLYALGVRLSNWGCSLQTRFG